MLGKTFDLDRDVATADAKIAHPLNQTSPDLRIFRSLGGKMVTPEWSYLSSPANCNSLSAGILKSTASRGDTGANWTPFNNGLANLDFRF